MRAIRRGGAITLLVLLLSACGQRGPLFLPDAEREVIVTPASPQPSADTVPAQSPAASPAASPPAAPADVPAADDEDPQTRRNNGTPRTN